MKEMFLLIKLAFKAFLLVALMFVAMWIYDSYGKSITPALKGATHTFVSIVKENSGGQNDE